MPEWQMILLWSLIGLSGMIWGWAWVAILRGKVYTETPWLRALGIYVWGDAGLLAPFWMLAAGVSLYQQDWLLFLLAGCVFWLVRGTGEMMYWLNQQFSPIQREPPEKFWYSKFFKNDSVWFIHQVWNQVIMMIALVGIVLIVVEMVKR